MNEFPLCLFHVVHHGRNEDFPFMLSVNDVRNLDKDVIPTVLLLSDLSP